MRDYLLPMVSIICCATGAGAQISFRSSDEIARDPYVACQAWFGISDTVYTTPDAPNHPKASTRFRYYADKFKKEQGRENINTDCLSFTEMADSLRNGHTPGFSYYNNSWKRQVTVASFPGLPSDWSTKPVPGEDGDPKQAPESATDLRTMTFRYAKGTSNEPGYDFASIDVRYRFIACMGEVHVAYSLDSKSVRAGEAYHSRNGLVQVGEVKPPEPSTIEMNAYVYPNPGSRQLGPVIYKDVYGKVSDKLAAPALGYGCFTGQTQKIGKVSEIVPGKHEPAKLDEILNDALVLGAIIKGFPSLKSPLRNAALDDAKTSMQLADEERATEDAARTKAANQAVQERVERQQREQQEALARAAADRKVYEGQIADFQRAQSDHAAETARAKAAQDEYDRQRAAYEVELKSGKYKPQ